MKARRRSSTRPSPAPGASCRRSSPGSPNPARSRQGIVSRAYHIAPRRVLHSRPMPGETILVVEDEPSVARGLEYGLKAEGFTVLVAGTGGQALRARSRRKGPGRTPSHAPGHPASRHERVRRLPDPAGRGPCPAHPHGDRAGRGSGQGPGPRAGRRRLHRQAVLLPRAALPGPRGAAPRLRGAGLRGRRGAGDLRRRGGGPAAHEGGARAARPSCSRPPSTGSCATS